MTVVAAESVSRLKIDGIWALGATVLLEGDDIEDARWADRAIAERDEPYLVEDSADPLTRDGAGTIGRAISFTTGGLGAFAAGMRADVSVDSG